MTRRHHVRIETVFALILAFLTLFLLVSGVGAFNQFLAKIPTAPNPEAALVALYTTFGAVAIAILGSGFASGMTWAEGQRLARLEEEWAKEKTPVYTGPPILRVVR